MTRSRALVEGTFWSQVLGYVEPGREGPDATWHVLADPEGNEFCLLRRRLDPV